VTAYNEYAVRAFEVNALDYILKPLKKERIEKAIERLLQGDRKELRRQQYTIEDTIFLSTGVKACFLKLKDIRYIQADSCYSRIIVSENIAKCSVQTLKKWADMLPVHDFVRIHRSYIVNIGHIARIEKRTNGTYSVFLRHIDHPIDISRRCASNLRSKLNL
jgi:two-component system LytT family response regulator